MSWQNVSWWAANKSTQYFVRVVRINDTLYRTQSIFRWVSKFLGPARGLRSRLIWLLPRNVGMKCILIAPQTAVPPDGGVCSHESRHW